MADFTIDVPISVKGGTGGVGGADVSKAMSDSAKSLQTWAEFMKGKMGPFMKSEGSHAAAMQRLSKEFKEHKARFGAEGPSGGGKGGSGKDEQQKTNKLLKKLDKSVLLTIDVNEILTSFFKDLIRLFRPLIQIISLLFLIIFLPLLPLLTKLTEGLAKFVFDVAEAGGGLKGVVSAIIKNFDAAEFIGLATILASMLIISFATGLSAIGWAGLILGIIIFKKDEIAQGITDSIGKFWASVFGIILVAAAGIILFAIGGWVVALTGLVIALIVVFWDDLKIAFKNLVNNFLSIGPIIKEKILKGLAILSTLGQIIIDGVKGAISGIGSFIGSIFGRAEGGPVNAGGTFLVGERGPELFTPNSNGTIIPNGSFGGSMGNVTININKPTLRNDSDIKQLANEVSRALQRQMTGRISSI